MDQQPKRSDKIDKLTAALCKVQRNLAEADRDAENPVLQRRYASLSSVWKAIRKPLGEAGLAVFQLTSGGAGSSVKVTTTLAHTSGQWIEETLELMPEQGTAQSVGMAITYARRYALAAMVGVTATEDEEDRSRQQERAAAAQAEAPKPSAAITHTLGTPRPAPASDAAGTPNLALSADAMAAALGRTPPKTSADEVAKHLADLLSVFPDPAAVLKTAWKDCKFVGAAPVTLDEWGALPAGTNVLLYEKLRLRATRFVETAGKKPTSNEAKKPEPPKAPIDPKAAEIAAQASGQTVDQFLTDLEGGKA